MLDIEHRDELLRVIRQVAGVFHRRIVRVDRIGDVENDRLADVLLE